MATYVISDLHGQKDAFERALELVNFSDSDFLYVLGDAIDRGPDGIDILQRIKNAENMDLLLGNHELFMLNCIDTRTFACRGKDVTLWLYYNGGEATWKAFDTLPDIEKKELMDWLWTRTLIHRLQKAGPGGKDTILTHSHYIPELEEVPACEAGYDTAWDVVWLSAYRQDLYNGGMSAYPESEGFFFFGHVPVIRFSGEFKPFVRENTENIDGGCAYGPGSPGNPLKRGAFIVNIADLSYEVAEI